MYIGIIVIELIKAIDPLLKQMHTQIYIQYVTNDVSMPINYVKFEPPIRNP